MTTDQQPRIKSLRLRATLADLFRMVGELRDIPAMGRDGRRILLSLKQAAHDLPLMGGLVVKGDLYAITAREEWAVCHCGDDKHELRKDWPRGRSDWARSKPAALEQLKRARQQHTTWDTPGRPVPHLVHHLVATTPPEEVLTAEERAVLADPHVSAAIKATFDGTAEETP